MIPPGIPQSPNIPLRLPSQRQESLLLRRNQQPPILHRPEQRFNPITIPYSDKELLLLVPEHAGELAAEPVREVEPVVQVQGDDDLGVAAAGEGVGGDGLEVCADGVVVVEFAVDDGVDAV